MLKGDIDGPGDLENGLIASLLFPGRAERVDARGVFRGVWVDQDEQSGVDAGGAGLVLSLPLAVEINDAETGGESGRDLVIEEGGPGALIFVASERAKAEEELCFDPAVGGGGVSGVVLERGRNGLEWQGRARRVMARRIWRG